MATAPHPPTPRALARGRRTNGSTEPRTPANQRLSEAGLSGAAGSVPDGAAEGTKGLKPAVAGRRPGPGEPGDGGSAPGPPPTRSAPRRPPGAASPLRHLWPRPVPRPPAAAHGCHPASRRVLWHPTGSQSAPKRPAGSRRAHRCHTAAEGAPQRPMMSHRVRWHPTGSPSVPPRPTGVSPCPLVSHSVSPPWRPNVSPNAPQRSTLFPGVPPCPTGVPRGPTGVPRGPLASHGVPPCPAASRGRARWPGVVLSPTGPGLPLPNSQGTRRPGQDGDGGAALPGPPERAGA